MGCMLYSHEVESYVDQTSDFSLQGQVLTAWHSFQRTSGAKMLRKEKAVMLSDPSHRMRLLHLFSRLGEVLEDGYHYCTTEGW